MHLPSLITRAQNWARRLLRPQGETAHKMLSSIDAYAHWAAHYPPNAHNALMQVEERAMLSLLSPLDGRTVLDLACGTGRYGLLAWDRGAARVVGVDNSSAMLAANSLAHKAIATSEAIPCPSDLFDVVICGLALGHLPRLEVSFTEIARVLKRGGYALISDFHPFISLQGAQRTFSLPNGATYAVEHYAHLYADYHRAIWAAGLVIEHLAEPRLDLDHPAQRHGEKPPIVLVLRVVKP
jgi:malonyl-CoA O-methyltransferase